MGRKINGIYFENEDSNTNPIIEAIIQEKEENKLIEELSKRIKIVGIDKAIRAVFNQVTETIEKEFQKNGGTVSR